VTRDPQAQDGPVRVMLTTASVRCAPLLDGPPRPVDVLGVMPAAIYLAVTGSWIKALLLTLWGVFVISLVDNFLRPRLVGKRAKLHELFIFFAVLGGLQVFGLIGLVLGPVVLAVALSLFETFSHARPGASAAHDMYLPADSPYLERG
jgi:hypothetical protein